VGFQDNWYKENSRIFLPQAKGDNTMQRKSQNLKVIKKQMSNVTQGTNNSLLDHLQSRGCPNSPSVLLRAGNEACLSV
jgi:hypothetical protein